MSQNETYSERRQTYDELRRNTYLLALAFVAVSSAVLIWLGNINTHSSPTEIVLLWLLLEAVCVVSYVIHRRFFRLAVNVLIGGLWLCNLLAVQYSGSFPFLYLFSLISLIASILTSRWTGVAVTAASSFVILSIGAAHAPDEEVAVSLLILWFTLLTGFIAFYNLYEALEMAWGYQNYAMQQMLEAREHRANLMQITRALNEAHQDLERTNTQLFHARQAAEEARRLKAQFAANVSHELRTPINLIVGFSETIVVSPGAYGVPLPPVYWADMNTIYRSARHLQSLINDVLDVSQIEAGQMAVVKEDTNPLQVIQEALSLARDLIESKGLAFNVQLPDSLPPMLLDRTRIRQVLLNLLSNAARFTDRGIISVCAVLEERGLRIEVSDTGIGIPAKDLDRVFEEFHQVEASLSRRKGGSGLGLTLCKQFVELHGGRIWAQSEGIPGKGSTFSFTLPLREAALIARPAHDLEPPSSAEVSDGGKYFVVLDSDSAIRQLFERYTRKHRAVGVDSISEALRLVETIRPTAVVVDEKKDYPALRAALYASGNQTPLVACAMPSIRHQFERYGVGDYLVKPVTGQALRDALTRLAPSAKNILLIDDDRDIIRMFTRMLTATSQHYHIWKAYSGEEGLALMRQKPPDVLILDMMFPDADGYALLESMKSDPLLANVPVIVASASGEADELTPATEGHLMLDRTSGFQPAELVRYVEALVEVITPANEPARPEIQPG